MQNKVFYFFIGTTAELIKLAPVIREIKKRKLHFKIITSGQTDVLFDEFKSFIGPIKADIALQKKGNKSSVIIFILWSIKTFFVALKELHKEFGGLKKEKSYFIVHGDTVSSLIGAIIARVFGLKVVHIESGLRSFNFLEPFPEEISRYIISILADIHFCPNEWCIKNLKNTAGVKINTKQNTLFDSYLWSRSQKSNFDLKKEIKGKYYILVVHRQEHVIFGANEAKDVFKFVLQNSSQNFTCVIIKHAISQKLFNSVKNIGGKKKIRVFPRLSYAHFMRLLEGAEYIATDGGSNQEEAYYMGKPTLILRKRTERIEGLGRNAFLSHLNKRKIEVFLKNYKKYSKPSLTNIKVNPSNTIVEYLIQDKNQ